MAATNPGVIPEMPLEPCPHCGTMLSSVVEGMCPGCLLDTVMGPPPSFPEDHFGDYALVQELAHGGTGVVYLARQNSLERLVALKVLTGGALASDAEVRRIHDEAKIATRLRHPNIVPILEVGVHEEIAYFTMPLMEGGSLAQQMQRFHGRFREAARLLETISRAVHHGHQRGILHRDLKPANVLLDAAGVPYVADFGLARALDAEARVTQTCLVEGTLSYMPLEQAQPGDVPLTVAVDVYSLGVILYELLTGRLPFEAESVDALLARMREGRPLAPRALQPRIPRSLEAICLKCLEQEPARRYGSAAELADELKRFLEDKPVLAMPAGAPKRAWMWCLRQPLGAWLLPTLLWALSVATVGTFQLVRAQEEKLRDQTLLTNVFAAPRIAQGTHRNLEKLGDRVEDMARDSGLVKVLEARDADGLRVFCEARYNEARQLEASGRGVRFERVWVEDSSGTTLGRWPKPVSPDKEFLYEKYDWRDYWQGAQRHARAGSHEAYISRAYVSESHRRLMFALSVPVYDGTGKWIGVLSATVASNSTLGALPFNEPVVSNHTVTLVSLLDRDRGGELPPDSHYAVISHHALSPGEPRFLDEKLGKQLQQALSESSAPEPGQPPFLGGRKFEDYRDPVSDDTGLAAFAPVGDTPFVVIVQTGEQEALAATTLLANHITWWSLPFALGTGLVWLVFWAVRSRSLEQRDSL